MTRATRRRMPASDADHAGGKQIFLSHSSADTPSLTALVRHWRELRFSVFADFEDPYLVEAAREKRVDAAVSDHLRRRIRQCTIFVFVASRQSIQSGWMPWELGLAHGAVGRVHIYRLDDTDLSAVPGREYLSLYEDHEFDASNAETYLRWVLAEAETEPANAAQLEAARDMAQRALKAFNEQRFGDVVKEFTESPLMQGAATVAGLRKPGFDTAKMLDSWSKHFADMTAEMLKATRDLTTPGMNSAQALAGSQAVVGEHLDREHEPAGTSTATESPADKALPPAGTSESDNPASPMYSNLSWPYLFWPFQWPTTKR